MCWNFYSFAYAKICGFHCMKAYVDISKVLEIIHIFFPSKNNDYIHQALSVLLKTHIGCDLSAFVDCLNFKQQSFLLWFDTTSLTMQENIFYLEKNLKGFFSFFLTFLYLYFGLVRNICDISQDCKSSSSGVK